MQPGHGPLPAPPLFASSSRSSPRRLCSPISIWRAPRSSPVMPLIHRLGLCCPNSSRALNALWRLPPGPLPQPSRSTQWGNGRPWPASGHVSGGMSTCTAATLHCGRTTRPSQPCSLCLGRGKKPLRIYRWSERLQAYNFTTLFTPGRENVVADLLSRATPSLAPDPSPDTTEPELILMLHTPLQATVSLEDLQLASAQDSTLSQLRTYIREGWPSKVPEELVPFQRVRNDLSCWICPCSGCPRPGIHICGELHGIPQHQRFLIVAYDLHSKWPEVVATGSVTTQVVTDFLTSLFARWGIPDTITTDNGPQFVSADFAAFVEDRGINHVRTAFYHPEANGGVERLNQTLKNGLRAHLADGLPFSAALRCTLLHYRATPHSTTGSSPALLMMGRELQLPLDRLRAPTAPAAAPYQSDRVTDRQRRMKQRFDKRRRVRPPPFAVLDWVRVRRPNRNHKLLSFWSTPLQVTDQLGPATFHLADGSRWHASRLRRVAPPSIADPGTGEDFDPTVGDLDLPAEQLQAPAGRPPESAGTQAEPEARPARVRASPSYLRDYVTDF
ncbi:hypothetical protein SKAU_G00414710 [Synaphobranchus kaupii]|uniref:Integrase catalytic domain-containing protein n=1 Tax=Synaphobranchus kaupii TaxID=118154 RepID=A0A9Q1I9I2_SYNKA|nr:hypothetical protein SKAU_G00414710 [Synaphobranchus kaupii]